MNNFVTAILGGLVVLGTIFVLAVFGGTFVWLVWPVVNHAFPQLVASGVLAGSLNWWDSVCLTWLFGLVIKSSHSSK